jgi:hypothetical protein
MKGMSIMSPRDPAKVLSLQKTQRESHEQRIERKARERSEIERRRQAVARLRFIEANMTAMEIMEMLRRLTPPIEAQLRTIERDIVFIRDNARRYLSIDLFDARFEISTAVMRYDLLARRATTRAMLDDPKSKAGALWARIALLATELKMRLYQEIGLVDRRLGTLMLGGEKGKVERVSGEELQKLFDAVNVVEGEVVSEAERAWLYGDAAAAERAALGTGENSTSSRRAREQSNKDGGDRPPSADSD